MPTTIAQHGMFDRLSGRWTDFHDTAEIGTCECRANLWGMVATASLVFCAACMAGGLDPAAMTLSDFAGLLSP